MSSIREVAKLAGVSPATVSRVMNGTAKVDEEKKQRVEQVIRETGFKPNEVARSLYKKSAHIIGVIVPNIENPFFNEMAKAIEEEAYRKGYRLTLCSSNNNIEKEKNNIDLLGRMNADGIILLTNEEEIYEKIRDSKIPVVVLDREISNHNEVACIQANNYEGGRMTIEYLLQCGCKHIVNMRGPQVVSSGRGRFRGYLDVCKERGLEPMYVECSYDYEDGVEQTEKILELFPQVDGIIAANDMVAISAYKVLNKHGLRVPEDVQLIGFDNIKISQLMTPELTTIEQPIAEMGARATEILIDYIEGRKVKSEHVFQVALIERETTKR
ncbi:LacI family DNA-binding transcriptional regulator [Lachnospiraceae bacterium LCP25S3_G4]